MCQMLIKKFMPQKSYNFILDLISKINKEESLLD